MQSLASIVLTFWAGSLWTVCAVVAPSLFRVLEDRRMAGDVAGALFRIETWIGIACAVVLAFSWSRLRSPAKRTDYLWMLATVVPPVVSELLLRPVMATARAAGDMARFGMLHGVSAGLFLIACLAALMLVVRFSRRAA